MHMHVTSVKELPIGCYMVTRVLLTIQYMLWRVTCDLQCHVKYLDGSNIWCHNQL